MRDGEVEDGDGDEEDHLLLEGIVRKGRISRISYHAYDRRFLKS